VAPERRAEFYKTMRQDIERLNGTINNVLSAAMYTDRPVADPRPLDLARLARRAVELTLARYQLASGAIRCEGAPVVRVAGDSQALETAVLNLLDNAVKYSKDGVRIEVEVWGDADGQAHVSVRDHGIGMSRTHLPFIFTRFYRIGTEVRRSRVGTGLGLFIVRAIVKGHRGTITADSPGPDRGSTFTISLPGLLEADAEAEGASEAVRA
jgi:two-component system sensor histidine kinase SenX3